MRSYQDTRNPYGGHHWSSSRENFFCFWMSECDHVLGFSTNWCSSVLMNINLWTQKGTKIENSVETSISNDSVRQWFHSTQMVVLVIRIQWNSQNKSTSLMARPPVLVLIGPLRASKRDQNWKFRWDFNFNWQCLSMISFHTNGCYGQ